jgi:monoamine oxidase
MNNPETIILGAGAAGLAAGAALSAAGRPFLILEARNRIGGRVHTIHDSNWPMPLEFGAEFIHGRPAESWELVRRASLRAYDVTDEHWQSQNGNPAKRSEGWTESGEIMDALNQLTNDKSFDAFLREDCSHFSEPGKKMARAFVEGLDAADANRVSAQSIGVSNSDGDTFDADTPFRIFDGYDRLIEALARPVPAHALRLNAVAQTIDWSPQNVRIKIQDGQSFSASRVIITLPIGVLLAPAHETGGVRFNPPLPTKTREAIALMRMGPVIKVLLRFHQAFWESGPWRDMGFLHSPGDVFPTWWTMLPCRVPLLTGWAGGPAAATLSDKPADEVLNAALHTLAPLLGVSESMLHTQLAAWHVSDWQADPYARGAYAYAMVGGADVAMQLSEPIEQTIYFAGEATHPGYAGTVAAAIASGNRAARQIMAAK